MRYSFVIPAHHRPVSLGRLLSSLVRETEGWQEGIFEVIIVIDGEDEAVTKEAKSRLGHLPVVLIPNREARGAAAARNQGAAFAQGEILVFLDDDVEVARGWGEQLCNLGTSMDLVSGDVQFGNPDRAGAYPERVVRSIGGGWPMGAHLLVRRELFLELGGFDEAFSLLHNEDSEFVLRLLDKGYRWHTHPTLAVHHEVAWWNSPGAVIHSTRYIAAIPQLIRLYPRVIHRMPLDRMGPILFPKVFLLTLSLPVSILPLLLRFCIKNRGHIRQALPFFFAKWPGAVLLYRWHLWKSAWKERVFVI